MDVEMKDEDAEDNMPLSELMELKKRKDMEMATTGVKVDKELMQAVRRVHNNLGHPEASKLVRALRIAGAKPEAIEAAKLLKCDVCKQLEQPSTRRPSQLPRAQNFNDHVAVDLFWVKDVIGNKYTMLNVVDVATKFQVVTPVKSKRPDDVMNGLERCWMDWAGPPARLNCDMGGEFNREFGDTLEAMGVDHVYAGVQAPWQNGLCERHGGAWKLAFKHVARANQVAGITDLKRATVMVNWAKNSRVNASGYSPSQWVLGRGMRMPWSLLDRAGQLAEHQRALDNPDFSKRLGMLTAARRAFEVLDTSQRLRRAWLGRSRLTPEAAHLPPGTVVYIYRKVKPRKGVKLPLLQAEWLGPAKVVGHEGTSVWCSYRGTCTKCAAEHVRRASDEEMLAFSALPQDDEELMEQLFDGKVEELPWAGVRRHAGGKAWRGAA